MIPNCAATRHAHFMLDGSRRRAARAARPRALAEGRSGRPSPTRGASNLDTLTPRGGRDAGSRARRCCCQRQDADRPRRRAQAHRRHAREGREAAAGVDFTNRVIYYVGPVDPVRDEVVGPAGPTTATRMDKFTEMMLAQDRADRDDRQGRARPGRDRGDPEAQGRVPDGGRRRRLSRVEGDHAARASSRSPTSAWKRSTNSTCKDMPVTVAVDATGTSVHQTGPREWQQRIGKIPVTAA